MMSTSTTNDLAAFDTTLADATVSAVYSGRPGCACGCRGKHSSDPRTIATITRNLRKAVADGADLDIDLGCYVAAQSDKRLWILYVDGRVA